MQKPASTCRPRVPGHRPHQAAAVGRVAVGPVDHGLDARLAEPRDALGGRDEARPRSGRGRAAAAGRGSPPGSRRAPTAAGRARTARRAGPRPPGARRTSRPGRGSTGSSPRSRRDLRDRVGDDVVVLERDDRQLGAREPRRPRAPTGRRRSRRSRPGPRPSASTASRRRARGAERRHRRVPEDRRAAVGGALRERVGRGWSGRRGRRSAGARPRGRRRVARAGTARARARAPTISTGTPTQLGDRRARAGTGRPGRGSCRGGRCRTGGSRPAGPSRPRASRRARPTYRSRPHQVVARVELRAEAGRVPGRAARQLVLLEQHDVAPAERARW